MVEYCLRRQTHQIDGNEVIVSKAIPKFDEDDHDKNLDPVVEDDHGSKVDCDNPNLDDDNGQDEREQETSLEAVNCKD